MPYWEDLKHNDPDDIDAWRDVTLPATMHHTQANAEVNLLVEEGVISDTDAQRVLSRWKAKKSMADTEPDVVEAAVEVLVGHGLLDEAEGEELLAEAA